MITETNNNKTRCVCAFVFVHLYLYICHLCSAIILVHQTVDRETRPNLTTSGRTTDTELKCADIVEAVAGLVEIFKVILLTLNFCCILIFLG